ncbi:MAG TPA: acetyltransferase [Dehalococcoidales bacterium]|nr:acetyltransferase [Dehalococcoidales bacterium]
MNIVIFGAGGHGRVVLDILKHDRRVNLAGFIDDNRNSHQKIIDGVRVLGDVTRLPELIAAHNLDGCVVAIGDNKVRAKLFAKVKHLGLKLENAIHPNALIAKDVEIGEGVVIASGAIINTGTRIGNNVIINTGVVIDHNNIIEDNVHISPGAKLAGEVTVKKYAHVGIGVTVVPHLTIGESAVVGAGAVVQEDIPDDSTAVGVPARVIKSKKKS